MDLYSYPLSPAHHVRMDPSSENTTKKIKIIISEIDSESPESPFRARARAKKIKKLKFEAAAFFNFLSFCFFQKSNFCVKFFRLQLWGHIKFCNFCKKTHEQIKILKKKRGCLISIISDQSVITLGSDGESESEGFCCSFSGLFSSLTSASGLRFSFLSKGESFFGSSGPAAADGEDFSSGFSGFSGSPVVGFSVATGFGPVLLGESESSGGVGPPGAAFESSSSGFLGSFGSVNESFGSVGGAEEEEGCSLSNGDLGESLEGSSG